MTVDIHHLPLHAIQDDDRYQPYPNMNPDEFESLLASMQAGFWPTHPILVDEDNYILCGHMRYKAARHLGLDVVPVQILTGLTEAQKMQRALVDNAARRQRLDDDARLAIARSLLRDFGSWSDRAIAGGAGLSPTTVGKLRKAVTPTTVHVDSRRVGLDGRAREVPARAPADLEHAEHDRLVKDVRALGGTAVSDDIQQEIVAAFEKQQYTAEKAGFTLGYIEALRARGLLGKHR